MEVDTTKKWGKYLLYPIIVLPCMKEIHVASVVLITYMTSHADFTPVCTTEFAKVVEFAPEFEKRDVKTIALSIDDEGCYKKKVHDIITCGKHGIGNQLGMLDSEEIDPDGMALTARTVFVIGPRKQLTLNIFYPATTGKNFDEILRVIDSLQLTATKKVVTSIN
uniref:Peroxiredoxin-6 (inferred by orthology to a human protein) n=1 Tax=Strongyloides venezuelensis TaxID=75913 RepID=A0A0K0F394_STRVS